MLTLLLRTIFIYFVLILMMRLLGKRQLGELEATELVTALLISEIATWPITDSDIPILFAIVPMTAIACAEIFTSFILIKCPNLRRMISSHPSIIINKGKLNQKELKNQRISIDELIASVRNGGYSSLDDIYYAIIEESGALTLIPKSSRRQPNCEELGLSLPESGLMHIIISDGRANLIGLATSGKSQEWLERYLESKHLTKKDIFLMLCDDGGNITLIKKEKK